MAKVAFTKLGLTKDIQINHIYWNDQDIEVKTYLPSTEKLELCSRIINESVDDQNFYNPGKVAIYQAIEIISAYTNINITEKQREDPCKLFDLFQISGLATKIYNAIPEAEIKVIGSIVECTIDNIYKYKNSILGILDTISTDYNNLDLDAQKIQKEIGDGKNVEFLKEVLTKLG